MAILGPKVERMLVEIAGRQHGAIARRQLLAGGLTRHTIQRLVTTARLLPVHDGVYLVAESVRSPLADEAAAVLACGPRAFLSHTTAGRISQLPVPVCDSIEITVVGRSRKHLKNARVHSIGAITRSELRLLSRLPISSHSLTLLDLAGVLEEHELAAALNEARVQRLVTDRQLRASLDAHPRRKGARALRAHLATECGPKITRSEAERRAKLVMRKHGIEPDASDVPIGPYRVDFLFRPERLAVEVDGYRYHGTPTRFVNDRRRTTYLAARNLQVFPLTWSDLHEGASIAMARLAATLTARRKLFGVI